MPKQIPTLTDAEIERFWLKVVKSCANECWLWNASLTGGGYGQFQLRGRPYRANRVVYFLKHDVDPGIKKVCHKCNTPACCNPRHLYLGSDKQNQEQCVRDGRGRRGTKNGRAKLNITAVRRIRRSRVSPLVLAKQYDVSFVLIYRIRRHEAWKHVA